MAAISSVVLTKPMGILRGGVRDRRHPAPVDDIQTNV
jgi:hypothetical protein